MDVAKSCPEQAAQLRMELRDLVQSQREIEACVGESVERLSGRLSKIEKQFLLQDAGGASVLARAQRQFE